MAETETTTEDWRPVVGYEGLYSVSSLGRVRRDGFSKYGKPPGTILRTGGLRTGGNGYLHIDLHRGQGPKCVSVHLLVLESFVGPRPEGQYANHRNGVKTDNRLDNLEWVTPSRNSQHAYDTGLAQSGDSHYSRREPWRLVRGDKVGTSTTSEETARAVVADLIVGMKGRIVAARHGVTEQVVSRIKCRTAWRHLTEGTDLRRGSTGRRPGKG